MDNNHNRRKLQHFVFEQPVCVFIFGTNHSNRFNQLDNVTFSYVCSLLTRGQLSYKNANKVGSNLFLRLAVGQGFSSRQALKGAGGRVHRGLCMLI